MSITVTVPADTKTPGTAGHTADHNTIVDAITALGAAAANTAGDVFTGGVTLAASSPGTPAANQSVLYASSVGTLTVKNDSGLAGPLPSKQVDTGSFPNTNPLAFANICKSWSIPAGDANAGTVYCIEVPFNGLWEASGNWNLGWQLDAVNTSLVVAGAAAFTAAHNYSGAVRFFLEVLTTGAGGTHRTWADGTCSDVSVSRLPANCIALNANGTGSINTTVAHTLSVVSFFSVTNASQTVNGGGSVFTRMGS